MIFFSSSAVFASDFAKADSDSAKDALAVSASALAVSASFEARVAAAVASSDCFLAASSSASSSAESAPLASISLIAASARDRSSSMAHAAFSCASTSLASASFAAFSSAKAAAASCSALASSAAAEAEAKFAEELAAKLADALKAAEAEAKRTAAAAKLGPPAQVPSGWCPDVGDPVVVLTTGMRGKVRKVVGSSVTVQAGLMQLKVDVADVRPDTDAPKQNVTAARAHKPAGTRAAARIDALMGSARKAPVKNSAPPPPSFGYDFDDADDVPTTGDKVRIIGGANKGTTGTVVADEGGLLTVQTGRATVAQIAGDIDEAARMTGASFPRRLVAITLPLASRGLIAGALLVFVNVVGDLAIVALLYTPDTPVLSVLSYRYASDGFQQFANAITVVILAISVAATALAQLLKGRRP